MVILLAVLAAFAAERSAEILNLRYLCRPLPAKLADMYDEAGYARSQAYLRERLRLSVVVASLDLVVVLAAWFSGAFAWLDRELSSLGLGPVPTGLLFLAALVLLHGLIRLPLSLYSTFVVEERYGFNRTTPATFAADRLKSLALAVVLGGPLLAAILAFFEYGGPSAWVYAWALATAFAFLGQLLLPAVILPLFNKFTPLGEGELRASITTYAARVDFPLRDISVMDGSRRSTKGNAFFTGFGRAKRIALFDTLIERHTVDELLSVLAHEIGHYRRRHVLKGTLLSVVQLGLTFALLALVLRSESLFEAFYAEAPSVHLGLVIFSILMAPAGLVTSVAINALSRRHEFEADRYSALTTGHPDELASALKKLGRDTLSQVDPHPFYVLLNYSHPPLAARVGSLLSVPPWSPEADLSTPATSD
jgi:STE24 endopeptidase